MRFVYQEKTYMYASFLQLKYLSSEKNEKERKESAFQEANKDISPHPWPRYE